MITPPLLWTHRCMYSILVEPTQNPARRNRQFSWCLNGACVFLGGVQGLVSSLDYVCFLVCEFDALVLFLVLKGCPQKAILPNKLPQAVLEQSPSSSPSPCCFCGFSRTFLGRARRMVVRVSFCSALPRGEVSFPAFREEVTSTLRSVSGAN